MANEVRRILWIDDEAHGFLSPLGQIITSKTGAILDIATTYDEALTMLGQTAYSAVISDVILPFGVGRGALARDLGLQLVESIRTGRFEKLGGTNAQIPVVILSVYELNEIRDSIMHLGVKYFDKASLLAPDRLSQLVSALQER